jgi:uncharacterized OB-fold protein
MTDSTSVLAEKSLASLLNEFRDALSNKRLPFCECASCHNKFPFPRTRCLKCNSDQIAVRFASGTGKIYAFTILHRSPSPSLRVPSVVAIIELAEGVKVYANVSYTENLAIGDYVELHFEDFNGNLKPVFQQIRKSKV